MKKVNELFLKMNLSKCLNLIGKDIEALVVRRDDNKDAVVVSLDEYNGLNETVYLLSGKNGAVLKQSIKELENGETKS